MASIAFLQVLLGVFFATSTTPVLSFTNGNNTVCLSPGDDGGGEMFNCACSNERLPDTSWNVQEDALTFIEGDINLESSDICTNHTFFGWGNDPGTLLFVYGGCNADLKMDECRSCVKEARGLVTGRCRVTAAGARAWNRNCCVRYEKYSFGC